MVFWDIVHGIGNLAPWKKVNDDDHYALSTAEIKSRMAGIPIYKVSNYTDSFVGVFPNVDPKRRLELHFFSKPDALDFFERMKPLPDHWRMFDAPLSDVLFFEGEKAVRLVPESSQIKNAFDQEKLKADDNFVFSGVPVFKSDAVRMKIKPRGNADFCPVFLRKEDLQDTMAALDVLPGKIEVASLEETIQEMKDSSTNRSNDLIFVGPGDTTKWLAN